MTLEREYAPPVTTERLVGDPSPRVCPHCRALVLEHPSLRALGVLLDCAEVIPADICPTCQGAPAAMITHSGEKEAPCWHPGDVPPRGWSIAACSTCHGTRVFGEAIGPGEQFVALSAWGRARPTTVGDWRRGEALHREHHCQT